ncbi:hypothetical protein N9J19_00465 [bacterium]|nr:hypothetical protein [bacterium]
MKKDFRSISQIYRDMHKPQLNEAVANTASLEYGTPKARNEYAKDTPGQSGGDPVQEPTHASTAKYGLSVNGVPKKNGEMDKPNFDTDTGLKVEGNFSEPELVEKLDPVGKADADIDNDGDVDTSDKYLHKKRKAIKKAITKEAVDDPVEDLCDCDCDCGKKICESCGKPKAAKDVKESYKSDFKRQEADHEYAMDQKLAKAKAASKPAKQKPSGAKGAPMPTSEGIGDMVKKGVEKVKKVRNDIKNFHKTDTAAAIRKDGMLIKKKASIFDQKEGFQVPEYSVFAEAMSVTLRPSKSQPGSYKVHSVGSKMKAHGGMKPGERVKDSHIDDMHDSGIKVKYHKEDTDLDEAGRWDDTTSGRRYRNMSPEEKKRQAKANELKKRAKSVYKGRGDLDKVSEAMSPAERKVAAGKIFRMHQAKQGSAQKAKSAAMRDSSGYKTSDDSHLDAKPSPKPKGKRGHSETPHIVGQLRGVVDTKGNHKGVQFKDGSTHKVSADHAKSWLAKHDAAKPSQKLGMYKHHDSHKAFKSGMSEEIVSEISDKTKTSYIKKAGKEITNREKLVQKIDNGAWNKGSGGAAIQKQQKAQADKRRAGVKVARGKLGEEIVDEATADQVAQARYRDKTDNPHTSAYLGKAKTGATKGIRVSKTIPGKNVDSNKGKAAAIKKQISRRPGDYGVDGKHDPMYPANKHSVQKGPLRQKSKATAGQYEGYSDKEVRMAKGIAFDKRHVGGDYTGAAKKMEKIKKGLSDHPKAKDALRRANEQKTNFAKSLFQQEAIERRADRKTIIATDPSTGRKVVKMAPKKEIDVGKGKMA